MVGNGLVMVHSKGNNDQCILMTNHLFKVLFFSGAELLYESLCLYFCKSVSKSVTHTLKKKTFYSTTYRFYI